MTGRAARNRASSVTSEAAVDERTMAAGGGAPCECPADPLFRENGVRLVGRSGRGLFIIAGLADNGSAIDRGSDTTTWTAIRPVTRNLYPLCGHIAVLGARSA